MRDLLRLAGCNVIDPEIARRSRAVVVVEQTLSIIGESGVASSRLVQAFRQRKRAGFSRGEVAQIDFFVAIYIGGESDVLALGRKFATANFPFVVGEPGNLFCRDVEQADVVVSVRGI